MENIEYEDLGDVEFSEEDLKLIDKKTDEAEKDIENIQMRINFRWGKSQVDVAKKAAKLFGIPYQTYIKQAIYRQSLKDIQESESTLKRN